MRSVSVAGCLLAAALGGVPSASARASTPPDDEPPAELALRVVATYPHSTRAFTEGLQVLDGTVYESDGLYGESSVSVNDLLSGQTRQTRPLDDADFAEGLAVVGDELVQLTWREGRAYVYDRATLERRRTLRYSGEGWGLCFDGTSLFMSDGSSTLTERDPVSFAVRRTIPVRQSGRPVTQLNELECAGGRVWANVWTTTTIVRIDPSTGRVDGVLDARPLLTDDQWAALDGEDVLNGIAVDEGGRMFVTGKRWPTIFEIDVIDPAAPATAGTDATVTPASGG